MGVKVKRNKKSGKLAFRIFWSGFPNGRSWETTDLQDTPENRQLVEARAVIIASEIRTGKFDYLRWFPFGNRSAYFAGRREKAPKTVEEYFEQWIQEKKPPLVRKSRERDYRQHWSAYLKQRFGSLEIAGIGVADLKELRASLLTEKLSLKTVKNIVAGTFRALLRDAQIDSVIKRSPFEDLPRKGWWPEIDTPPPDPFDFEERENVCQWFYNNDRHYWPFVTLHLYQSVRPSESTALNWGRVDVDAGLAIISKSRHLQADNAPKTRAARRVIHLKAHVAAILRSIKPLHVKDETPVFLNKLGSRVSANEFRNNQWYRALRILEIRQRDFYSTKDTAISLDITAGEHAKKVAQEAGISLATLERNYGIHLDKAAQAVQREVQPRVHKNRKALQNNSVEWRPRRDLNPCYRRERPVSWAGLDDGDAVVSRAGFEPATLCLKGRCSTA
jgi:hypothetical protein